MSEKTKEAEKEPTAEEIIKKCKGNKETIEMFEGLIDVSEKELEMMSQEADRKIYATKSTIAYLRSIVRALRSK